MPPFLESEDTLDLFIRSFTAGTLPRAEWTHAAHVALGSWHLLDLVLDEALRQIRLKIQGYNDSQGIANTPDSGYHETLTHFWAAMIEAVLSGCDPGLRRVDKIRYVVGELGPRRDLHRDYYSFDVVKSREARAAWIPPDRSLLTYPVTALT